MFHKPFREHHSRLRFVVIGQAKIWNNVLIPLRLVGDLIRSDRKQRMGSKVGRDFQVDHCMNRNVKDIGDDLAISSSHRVLLTRLQIVLTSKERYSSATHLEIAVSDTSASSILQDKPADQLHLRQLVSTVETDTQLRGYKARVVDDSPGH